ncbi:hypothetical protein HS125_08445 [bacterium]|nr:hypothetical protein [bacterium]
MFITLEDETGMLQCVIKPPVQERFGDLLTQPALIVRGPLSGIGAWRGLVVEEAWPLAGMLGGYLGHPAAHGGADYRADAVG